MARPLRVWRRLVVRIALATVSTILVLLLCEVGIRIFIPQCMFPRYVTNGGFGIRVNVPNARYWHTSPEVRVQFRINAMGIRSDADFPFEKPPGVIRIVGLGDSFTQGYEVDLEETYLYRLERILRGRGHPVEVINLGVSGYGTAEELIMLKEFGLRFDPDVVILAYFQNDLEDNIRSDLYRLDATDALVRASPTYLPAVALRNKLYSFRIYRWLSENSNTFALAREALAELVKRRMVEDNGERTMAADDEGYIRRLGARLLDEVKATCDARGTVFLLLDIPAWSLSPSNLPRAYLGRVGSDDIVETAPRLNAEGPGAYLYRRQGHLHWTPRAHEIAAELLAERLMILLEPR